MHAMVVEDASADARLVEEMLKAAAARLLTFDWMIRLWIDLWSETKP